MLPYFTGKQKAMFRTMEFLHAASANRHPFASLESYEVQGGRAN